MYETLVYRCGAIFALLLQLKELKQFQGERRIAFTSRDGKRYTLFVYIDGEDFQLSSTPVAGDLNMHVDIQTDQDQDR